MAGTGAQLGAPVPRGNNLSDAAKSPAWMTPAARLLSRPVGPI